MTRNYYHDNGFRYHDNAQRYHDNAKPMINHWFKQLCRNVAPYGRRVAGKSLFPMNYHGGGHRSGKGGEIWKYLGNEEYWDHHGTWRSDLQRPGEARRNIDRPGKILEVTGRSMKCRNIKKITDTQNEAGKVTKTQTNP